ncbi:hypothetical protein SDC9_208814 [bioreactor metagenome]|uniref:Uncharacterized protein n=1 Tax=bioreactor metagenome TaxID=1076179 RepID=A0A645JDD4_9ZZZZ
MPAQYPAPQARRVRGEDVLVATGHPEPGATGELLVQLAGRPPGVAGENAQICVAAAGDLHRCVQVQQADVTDHRTPARRLFGGILQFRHADRALG